MSFPFLKKSLTTIALWCNLMSPSFGEILFDWKVPIDVTKKQTIEKQIQSVAKKFKQKPYGDVGAYDFLAVDHFFLVAIEPTSYLGQHISDEDLSMIFLDPALLYHPEFIKLIALHELSHAYDHAIARESDEKGQDLIETTHHRAIEKEQIYLTDLAKTIPFAEYLKVNKAYEILQEIRHVNSILSKYEIYQFHGVPLYELGKPLFQGMIRESLASLWRPALEKIK